MNSSQCRSCKAPVIWIKTRSGRRMPLDAKPEKRIVVNGEYAEVTDTYVSHFVTCPNASEHRRSR